jgi:hypothetical protein
VKQAQALAATQASWWSQFPASLRRVAMVRLVGSIGAVGVLYLTPLVFHRADFSASNVTLGVALAAVTGTIGRFVSGALLDRGCRGSLPVLPDGLREQLKIGGRLGVIVGDSPVMSAQVITRVSESAFSTLRLFETDVPPLRNALRPSSFRF